MRTETDIDLRLLADIREAMGDSATAGIVPPGKEPVGQTINSIVSTLDEWIFQAKHPETYRGIAKEAIGVGQIQTRVQLLLSFFKSHEEPKLKVLTNGQAK